MTEEKKSKSDLKADSIKEFMAKVNKQYGKNTIIKGSQIVRSEWPRVTTGEIGFDAMLGGGWPVNQWNEVIGLESSGKTVLALKTIAANQAKDKNYEALWVAAEDWVDSWARTLGVDIDRMTIIEDNVMEKCFQIVDGAIDNQLFDAVVIDSLPALIPGEEAEKAMEEFSMATGAKLIAKFMRKSHKSQRRDLVDVGAERDILCLMINQWRDKIGVVFGDSRITPGGKAKNFSFFTRVQVARDEWLTIPSTNPNDKAPVKVGQSIKASTLKNKTAPPQRSATVDFYFSDEAAGFHAGEYDEVKQVFNMAVARGVIDVNGRTYTYGEEKLGTSKGEAAISIREDLKLQEQIAKDVMMLTTRNGETQ